MIREFNILFQVALKHGFYAGGKCRNMVLEPTASTAGLMNRYELKWKADAKGYFLAYGREVTRPIPLAFAAKPLCLRFLLNCSDPYFFNITAIPFFKINKEILYFNNLSTTVPGDQPSSLSQSEKVNGTDVLPVYGSMFNIDFPAGNIMVLRNIHNQEVPEFIGQDGKKIDWIKRSEEPSLPDQFQITGVLSPGKYAMDTGQEPLKWFYYSPERLTPGTLGIVEIYIGESDNNMVPAPDRDEATAALAKWFGISFEPRSTLWRYYLMNSKDNKAELQPSEVTDGKSKLAFTIGPPQILRNGDSAIPVVSDTPITLLEQQVIRPQLKLVKKDEGVNLPTPDWQQITPEGKQNDQHVYSDMYIYIH